jgi:hypothetical protein
MTQFTIVVDCNDPQYTREICAAFALFPEVKAVLPEDRRPRGALRLLLVSRPAAAGALASVEADPGRVCRRRPFARQRFRQRRSALPGGG